MAENDETKAVPWPNQQPVVDGVVPTFAVSQDPDLFDKIETTDTAMEADDGK